MKKENKPNLLLIDLSSVSEEDQVNVLYPLLKSLKPRYSWVTSWVK